MLGTGLIVGLCYAVAAPVPQAARPGVEAVTPTAPGDFSAKSRAIVAGLESRSGKPWPLVLRSPFAIVGDAPVAELETIADEVLAPTRRALATDYFDRDPSEPILVVLLSSSDAYRLTLESLGYGRQAEYSGLYHREERMMVLNLSTGRGTVAHELTHALAHADFPNLPEWFDEGLASLHEESEFSADGLHLIGRDNWRRRFLEEALERDCWKSLDRLLTEPFAEPDFAALDYALARNLCLYLQERGLLAALYRKCRSGASGDPSGRVALERLCGKPLDEIDVDFRAWLAERF
jgi:hypothetical protein